MIHFNGTTVGQVIRQVNVKWQEHLGTDITIAWWAYYDSTILETAAQSYFFYSPSTFRAQFSPAGGTYLVIRMEAWDTNHGEWQYQLSGVSGGIYDRLTHWAITYDASKTTSDVLLYVDGVLQTVTSKSSNPAGAWVPTQRPWNVGNVGTTYNGAFSGDLGQFAVIGKRLTTDQIGELFGGISPEIHDPIWYHPMDNLDLIRQVTNGTLTTYETSGNNITFTNGPTLSTRRAPVIRPYGMVQSYPEHAPPVTTKYLPIGQHRIGHGPMVNPVLPVG